jgi:hypothetical protein
MAQESGRPIDGAEIELERDVVAWGDDEAGPRTPFPSALRRLGLREEHLPTVVAGGGAALVGLSLLTTWQSTLLPPENAGNGTGRPRLETTIAGLQVWGSSYTLGLMGLFAVTAVALFGSSGARRQARIAGLGWAAGLLGLLLATTINLNDTSMILRYYLIGAVDQPDITVGYGPGPFLAIAGVASIASALYLTGRRPATPEPEESEAPAPAPNAGGQRPERARRPGGGPVPVGGPADLTVGPATPFVRPEDLWRGP